MQIIEDDLTNHAIEAMLNEHYEEMHSISPRESVHTLDIEALRATEITFWTIWENEELLGCGALREIDKASGEIKSMRTAYPHRGKGVATVVLNHIISVSRQRGYKTLYLETGSMIEFEPARALYQKHGFCFCKPFAQYKDDPNSVFMELRL